VICLSGSLEATARVLKTQLCLKGASATPVTDGEGSAEWTIVEKTPVEPELTLSLVLEGQEPGDPDHWSLFVVPEDDVGRVLLGVLGYLRRNEAVYSHLM
jgi:hypothetical protein